jgi:hypothetical protein
MAVGADVDIVDGAAPPTGAGTGAAVGPITGAGVGAIVVCADPAVPDTQTAALASAATRRTFIESPLLRLAPLDGA